MTKTSSTEVLSHLRQLFSNLHYVPVPVQACIVPCEDAHQSEYIAACDRRVWFVSGFSGSRALAVVTSHSAALWTDGRYFTQAALQMDENWQLMREGVKTTPSSETWLVQQLPPTSHVAVDAELVSEDRFDQIARRLGERGLTLVPSLSNLVDAVWGAQRPARPCAPLIILEQAITGLSWQEKVQIVRNRMNTEAADVLLVSALDEVAWLFNLRGSDITFNPVFFSFALITADSVSLFLHEDRITPALRSHLPNVQLLPYNSVSDVMHKLSSASHETRFWLPSSTTSKALASLPALENRSDRRLASASPIALLKAVKNAVEMRGMRDAHIRDGAAHCEFLHWLENAMHAKSGIGHLTEISVAEHFQRIREEQDRYVSLSFATISAVGPHSAMPHYNPSRETDAPLSPDQLFLVDSGAQYRDGTTDVTRTIAFSEPSLEQKRCNTLVLKGHIQLARQVFPEGTNGMRLDSLSRIALWQEGLDFGHGTGHGVGHFLNVHEGPMGIGYRALSFATEGLTENMVMTIEPGFYKDGEFGIRIENVYAVVPAAVGNSAFGRFVTFESLTMVPIQKKLLHPSLLTANEIEWLNDYHEQCVQKVGPVLEAQGKLDVLKWLQDQCKPLD